MVYQFFLGSRETSRVLIFSISLAVVSYFIWKFYRSTSKKNLIVLNLNQYNRSSHPVIQKFLAIILYFLEYILILPFLLLLWFAGLSIVLLMIASERQINEILLISAATLGAVRILAYFHSEIAKDLAKMFPFIALSVFILTPGALDVSDIFQKISEIPSLMDSLFSYLVVIFVMEIFLRIFSTIFDFWKSEKKN